MFGVILGTFEVATKRYEFRVPFVVVLPTFEDHYNNKQVGHDKGATTNLKLLMT